MVTVIATPGAANANSYQTVAEIDAYYETRVPLSVAAQWTSLTADEKARAAVTATLWMNSLIIWNGYPTASPQTLQFPRNSLYYWDGWSVVPNDIIPVQIKAAHAEFARIIAQTDRTAESDVAAQGLTRLKVGPIDMSFTEYTAGPPVIPLSILKLIPPSWIYCVNDGLSSERELVRT